MIKAFFTQNALLKVVSIVLAVILWMFVVGEERAEVGLSIPIELINLPPNLVITGDVERAVNVRVNGPRRLVRRLQTEPLHKTIDLSGVRDGNVFFEIVPDSLLLPHGVEVVGISPDTIGIALERLSEKEAQILVLTEGKTEEGFAVDSITVKPEKVRIQGPSSALKNMHSVWTKPIRVDEKRESFKTAVSLDVRDPHLKVLTKEPIVAEVRISEKRITKRFEGLPIQVVNAEGRYSIKPDHAAVIVTGLSSVFEKALKDGTLAVRIDLKGLSAGRHLRQVKAELPVGTELVEVNPSVIEVHITGGEPEKQGE
ncbi:MAG: hypothetical protein HY788_16710 [Deltaproteobacteria bacterium]|nr:hypothetical protein [Deltaproteobacteria bacterium]